MTSKAIIASTDVPAYEFDRKTAMSAKGFEVDTALANLKGRMSLIVKAGDGVMFDAALFTWDVTHRGLIGKGEGARWATQGDYVTNAETGLGFDKSYGTQLVRLGYAVGPFNVKAGSKEWTFLAKNASKAPVGKVLCPDALDERGRVKAEYRTALAALVKNGIPSTTRPAQVGDGSGGDSGEGGSGEGGSGEGTVVAGTVVDPVADASKALDALDAALKNLPRESAEAWAAIENRMHAIITREVQIRTPKKTASKRAAAK